MDKVTGTCSENDFLILHIFLEVKKETDKRVEADEDL